MRESVGLRVSFRRNWSRGVAPFAVPRSSTSNDLCEEVWNSISRKRKGNDAKVKSIIVKRLHKCANDRLKQMEKLYGEVQREG